MTDNATSVTISAERSREPVLETVALLSPCFNASERSSREVCSAGTSPKSTVDTSESPSANRRTVMSTRTSSMRGRFAGDNATSPCTSMEASRRPASPATPASTQLSVSSCRTTRARPAPSAARSAISRVRPADRASRRFAILAHAMSHTTPTPLISTHNVDLEIAGQPLLQWNERHGLQAILGILLCESVANGPHLRLRAREVHASFESSRRPGSCAGCGSYLRWSCARAPRDQRRRDSEIPVPPLRRSPSGCRRP